MYNRRDFLKSMAYKINHWLTVKRGDKEDVAEVNKQLIGLIDLVINEAYK